MFQFKKCIFSYDVNYLDGEIFFLSEGKIISDISGHVFSSLPMESEVFNFGKIGNWYWADDLHGQIFLFDFVADKIAYQNRKEEFKVSIGWSPVFIDSSSVLVSRRFGREKKANILELKDFSFVDVPYQGQYGYSEYSLVVDRVRDSDKKVDFLIAYDTLSGTEKWRYEEFCEYYDDQPFGGAKN